MFASPTKVHVIFKNLLAIKMKIKGEPKPKPKLKSREKTAEDRWKRQGQCGWQKRFQRKK